MKRFKKILCVCPSGHQKTKALEQAVSLARSNQANLTIVDVVPEGVLSARGLPGVPRVADLKSRILASRRQELQSLVEQAGGDEEFRIDAFFGTLFLEVVRSVVRDGYDLVIKDAENPGWTQRLFGSDDMHLFRKCPCPVWMVGPDDRPKYANILAAVDLDLAEPEKLGRRCSDNRSLNEQIVNLGVSMSLSGFAQLHLVHAWNAPEIDFAAMWTNSPETTEMRLLDAERSWHQDAMDQLMEQLRERLGPESYEYLSPLVHLPRGDARTVVPELAHKVKADVVIMGTVARTGIRGLIIGNTAEAILDQLPCSVIAVKPEGFVTPVI